MTALDKANITTVLLVGPNEPIPILPYGLLPMARLITNPLQGDFSGWRMRHKKKKRKYRKRKRK